MPPATARVPPTLAKRSFALSGHRTSVALEPEFWDVLERLARRDGRSLTALVAGVDAVRDPVRPLASALRVHALLHAMQASNEPGSASLRNKTGPMPPC